MAAVANAALSALLGKTTIDDHQEILQECDKALKKSKTDANSQHSKVVALLKLDRYDEAIEFIERTAELKEKAPFEYAYALYKNGRFQEAAETASQLKSHKGAQHVEAQARYRIEQAARTSEIYKSLAATQAAGEDLDLRVNLGAVDALSQWLGVIDARTARRPGREDLEAFETAYNAACGSVARGELTRAEVLLKRAKELCRHSEDLSDEQKAEELLPMIIQHIYVLQSLGKEAEAQAMMEEVTIDEITDFATRTIALNNSLLASKTPSNPFLVHRVFSSRPKLPGSDKLFSFQDAAIISNERAVELKAFKHDGIINSTSKSLSGPSSSVLTPSNLLASIFNSAGHARGETGNAAAKKVLPQLQQRPKDVGLSLTIVQLYISSGNTTAAIDAMESLFSRLEAGNEQEQATRYAPGLVSLLVSLYKSQGRRTQIKSEFAKAASYWKDQPTPPSSLLLAIGTSLLESSDSVESQTAAEMFTKYRDQRPADKYAIAGYVASHAGLEYSKARAEAEKLSPVTDMVRNIDVNALENAGIPPSTNALSIAQLSSTRKRGATDGVSSKPKRLRKSRLPKDYDPSKKPDSERWLPMRDRSYYRPRGKKKGRKGGNDRTQGGLDPDDARASGTSTPTPGVVQGGNKKKKGKGKK